MKDSRERLKAVNELLGYLIGLVLLSLAIGLVTGMALVMAKFQMTFAIAAPLVAAVLIVFVFAGYLVARFKRLVVM